MTEITRKTGMKECKAIMDDPSSSPELIEQAKKRYAEIKDWLDKQPKKESTTKSETRNRITPEAFKNLDKSLVDAIKKESDQFTDLDLCRIYHIEQKLESVGIFPSGPFVGMLFNTQMARKEE